MGTQSTSKPKVTQKSKGQRARKKKKNFFDLSTLIPDKLELTIRVPDEDREVIINKIDEIKDEMVFNWRIVQIIMSVSIILAITKEFFL